MTDEEVKTEKFGKLVFVSMEPSRNKYRYCKWKCDCGNEIIVRRTNILNGNTTSCGCTRKQTNSKLWKGFGEISQTLWYRILEGARRRKLEVSITKEDAWNLFLKQNRKCALTDEMLIFAKAGMNATGGTASLDRINSDKGYTIDNIQWVHRNVNLMKQNLSPVVFLEWCRKIVDKQSKIM